MTAHGFRSALGFRPALPGADVAGPAGRDPAVDAVRAFATVGVVAGHWLVTGLVPTAEGLRTASPLSTMPAFAPASWVLQTLGLFFFAGGFAAARSHTRRAENPAANGSHSRRAESLAASRSRSGPAAGLPEARFGNHRGRAARRRGRLGRPVLVLVTLWSVVAFLGAALGAPTVTLRTLVSLAWSPLWFLLPYLALTLATRPLSHVVARFGPLAALPPIVVVAASDAGLVPGLAALPAAWAVPWLLGMGLATPARPPRGAVTIGPGASRLPRSAGMLLALGGAAGLAVLIRFGHYPASAVGVPGAGRSNLSPPSLFTVALAVTQIGGFLLLRGRLTRLLTDPRARRPVTALNRSAVGIYLSHQSVLLAVTGAAALLNPAAPGLLGAPDGAGWVARRLVWLPLLGLVLWAVTRRPGPITLRRA